MIYPAILFTHMKTEVDGYFKKYGTEKAPPPPQVFTIANAPKDGNIHFVQKVFQGAFEVCCIDYFHDIGSQFLV